MKHRLRPALAVLCLCLASPAYAGLPDGFDFESYTRSIGQRESSDNYGARNKYGYLGRYQMGSLALTDAGYKRYNRDGTYSWTGRDGVNSAEDFLANPHAQDNAFRAYTEAQWGYIRGKGLNAYVGQATPDGTAITPGGLLMGAHLVGAGGLKSCLSSGGTSRACTDGNGTHAFEYIRRGGRAVPCPPEGCPPPASSPSAAPVTGIPDAPIAAEPGSGIDYTVICPL